MNIRAHRRTALGIALLSLLAAAVTGYFYANWEMTSRVQGYRGALSSMGYGRGGRIPDRETFTAEVAAAAAPFGLDVRNLQVTRSEESGRDAAGELAQGRLGSVAAVRMELVRYRMTASVDAEKWLFRETFEVDVERTYRREVHLEPAASPPPRPLPRVAPTAPRGI